MVFLILVEQIRGIIIQYETHKYLNNKLGKYLVWFAKKTQIGHRLVAVICLIMLYVLIDYRYTFVRTFGIIFPKIVDYVYIDQL